MNIDYKLIGSRIKETRKARNMTQERLAERLDVSVGYVSQVERGITKISLDLLGGISTVLECDVASLITHSAMQEQHYASTEWNAALSGLSAKNKLILLEIAKLLQTNE